MANNVIRPELTLDNLPDDTPILEALESEPIKKALSTRLHNCLRDGAEPGDTVGDIRNTPNTELLRIPNLGPHTLKELRQTIGGGVVDARPRCPTCNRVFPPNTSQKRLNQVMVRARFQNPG